jgi:hypothetical protein
VFVVAVRSRPAGAFVWVLGSRSLPRSWFPFVSRAVAALARSGLGGALGADLFALLSVSASLPAPWVDYDGKKLLTTPTLPRQTQTTTTTTTPQAASNHNS